MINYQLLSVVIPVSKKWNSEAIEKFLNFLATQGIEYEVIFCIGSNLRSFQELIGIIESHENTAAYEVLARDMDAITSFGLEIALGDWVIELQDLENLQEHFEIILSNISNLKDSLISNVIVKSETKILRDRLLLLVFKLFAESKVVTFQRTSRASSRDALIYWNRRAFKNKVLRLATVMPSHSFNPRAIEVISRANYDNQDLLKIGIRSIVYSSMFPLRFVAGIALSSAALAILYSVYIIFVKYGNSSAPGWASTNLILSGLSFSLFVVLYAICEYLYQIVGAVVQNASTGISREILNKKYSFREKENIQKIQEFETSD